MRKFTFSRFTFFVTILSIVSILFFLYNTLPIGGRLNDDDLRNTYSAEMIITKGSYVFTDDLNKAFNTFGFIPPGHLINNNKEIFINGSFGSPLVFSTMYAVIGNIAFSNLIQVLIYILIWLTTYLLLKEYIKSKSLSMAGSVFVIYTPLLLSNLNIFYPDLTSLCILAIAFYFLIRGFNQENALLKYISIFLFSFSVLFKINNIVILAPIFLYLLVKKRVSIRLFFITIAVFIITVFPQFFFNKITMGEYSEFSYTSYSNAYDGNFSASSNSNKTLYQDSGNVFLYRLLNEYILPQKTDKGYSILLNLKVIFLSISLLSPILLLLLFGRKNNTYLTLSLYIFLVSFLFYGNLGGGFGMGELNIRSSFFRYLLFPLYLLLVFSLIYLFRKGGLLYKGIILPAILINFIFITSIYPFPAYTFGEFKRNFYIEGERISKIIPKGSIILVPGFDDGFLTRPGYDYNLFNYGYIPKEYQDGEIRKVIENSFPRKIPVYIYYINTPSVSWGSNHLYSFKDTYNVEEIGHFGKYYYFYKVTGIKNENTSDAGL